MKIQHLFYGFLFAFLTLFGKELQAQTDYSWWNTQQNWNGFTSWVDYMILSPYYLGPNALPVPFSEKGEVGAKAYFRIYSDWYHQAGGDTQDLGGKLYLPLVKNAVAFEMWGIFQEHYSMSETLAVENRARHQHPRGFAVGDVYFATVVALPLPENFPDVALRIGLRTASGNRLYEARYTDTPGYFFDLSAGKNLDLKQNSFIRFHAMLGFYSWQTNLSTYHQDDAFLYGAGMDYSFGKNTLSASLAGYSGYLGKRKTIIINELKPIPFNDRPMVFRVGYSHEWQSIQAGLRYQYGLYDFKDQSIRLWIGYSFPIIKMGKRNQ